MKRSKALWLGVGLVLVACGGDDSSNGGGNGGGKTLISSSSVPADSTCPNGGTKLSVGTDTNGNGTLDPDEVTGSQEICNASAPTLTTVTPTGPDATCKNGGVIVKSGPDTNGNGKLDDSEVTQTQEICDGGTSAVLSTTTTVTTGDTNCPLGGTETQSGADNGANGGIAGNGVLEPGEITSTTYACASLPGFFVGGFAPPPAVSGQQSYVLDTHGGTGAAGTGGAGGPVNLTLIGTLGGHVRVFGTGVADASFKPPSYTPSYGAVKLDVTADTTLAMHADGTTAADGEYYFLNNGSGPFFRQDSTKNELPVTGVHVAAGKTFTLPAGVTQIATLNDIVVEGTVACTRTSGNGANVMIQSAQGAVMTAAGSKIDASGAPVANASGGMGGGVTLTGSFIIHQGDIDTSGADGGASGVDNGGSAGPVLLEGLAGAPVAGGVFSTGNIKANGGNGTGGGNGGSATAVQVVSGARAILTSGNITANGGNGSGTTGNGGMGAGLLFATGGGVDRIAISGTINVAGGNASSTCTGTCTAGSAQAITINQQGGDFDWNADLTATGGNAVGATGGSGAAMNISLNQGSVPIGGTIPTGNINVSGNLRLFAGNGSTGGGSGGLTATLNPSNSLVGQQITFYGYSDIKTYGGDGSTGGGAGGAVRMATTPSSSGFSQASGGIVEYANISEYGGKATSTGTGGSSNGINVQSSTSTAAHDDGQLVILNGNVDAHGGDGPTGGSAPPVSIVAPEGIFIGGNFNSSSGNSSGAGVTAPGSGPFTLGTGGPLNLGGTITANGGNASGAGSPGGVGVNLVIIGGLIDATKTISSNGGNSNGVTGGQGGQIILTSQDGLTTHASVTSTGGTGTPAGTAGIVFIDGTVQ